ncbi:serine hydrolase [Prosthecobacter fusiformis]|nr:serine hydrolase [Prosthecobacter fusiformis]
MKRRHLLKNALGLSSALLTGCALPPLSEVSRTGLVFAPAGGGTPFLSGGARRTLALREYQQTFLVSGASFRCAPKPAFGLAWTNHLQHGYTRSKRDPRIGYAVKNLATGTYLAEHQADLVMNGCSMPKPALSAVLLDARAGRLTREEFQHIVNVCDLSINASWMALLARISHDNEQTFEAKYSLPDVPLRENAQSPRYYAEFFERCVNYRLDHGCELMLEAMRRNQYGIGHKYLPAEVTYLGGKTGNYADYQHEGLFFYYQGTPYAIVLYTGQRFALDGNYWLISALFGGLFREYIA